MFIRACAGCHGRKGEGGEQGEQSSRAINELAFLGASISDKRARGATRSPAGPISGCRLTTARTVGPVDFRPLTSAQIDDLVALLASWRQGGRAGDQ